MIVLDSSFLVAFHNARDNHHQAARTTMERLVGGEWGEALLPEYVYLEVVTVLAIRRTAEVAIAVGETLLRAREVEFVPCSEHFAQNVDGFRTLAPLGLSFVDAAIVTIARHRGGKLVATFDADFRKVGDLRAVP